MDEKQSRRRAIGELFERHEIERALAQVKLERWFDRLRALLRRPEPNQP